jgi:hypothetical protein
MNRLLPVCLFILLLAACGDNDHDGGGGGAGVPGGPQIILIGPPVWVAGEPYTEMLLFTGVQYQASPLLTWSVVGGALPSGVGLSGTGNNGTLSGTPTTDGSYSFDIEVRLDASNFYVQSFSMDILPAGTLFITTTSLPRGFVGTAYGQNVTAVGGTGVGYTWSITANNLPQGVSLDSRDVTLSWGAFTQTGNLDQSLGGGKLSEVSGIAASRSQPGVFWVHDDSGAGSSFYAIDAAGNVLQEYTITAAAQDWEDIAMGPGTGGDAIYIGDVGDNASTRTNCRIHRIAEPILPGTPGAPINVAHDEFWFVYPGGAQNCETMLINWTTGAPYLVEKTSSTSPRVHRFPVPLDTAWTAAAPVTLNQVAASGTYLSTLTGGDASPDGRRIVLRGYSGAFEYALPAGASFNAIFNQPGSTVATPGGQQYEAIGYSGDGTKLFTTTEIAGQANAPIWESPAAADNGYTTISGTPTAPNNGYGYFTLQVMDSAGNTATRELRISVP